LSPPTLPRLRARCPPPPLPVALALVRRPQQQQPQQQRLLPAPPRLLLHLCRRPPCLAPRPLLQRSSSFLQLDVRVSSSLFFAISTGSRRRAGQCAFGGHCTPPGTQPLTLLPFKSSCATAACHPLKRRGGMATASGSLSRHITVALTRNTQQPLSCAAIATSPYLALAPLRMRPCTALDIDLDSSCFTRSADIHIYLESRFGESQKA
jgi:hypothetical protein